MVVGSTKKKMVLQVLPLLVREEPQSVQLVFFFEKSVQLIDFTRIVHVNVNNNFFCSLKKLV